MWGWRKDVRLGRRERRTQVDDGRGRAAGDREMKATGRGWDIVSRKFELIQGGFAMIRNEGDVLRFGRS